SPLRSCSSLFSMLVFFFSSRRRHTRFSRDWSSDVCSSDLEIAGDLGRADTFAPTEVGVFFGEEGRTVPDPYFGGDGPARTGCTQDRKSTRLNSSHVKISYAVFCLKKKIHKSVRMCLDDR